MGQFVRMWAWLPTYTYIHRHGGRSRNLWGQKYLCLFNLEFKHEWSSLRLFVHSKLSNSLIHQYGPICKNLGVTTYLRIHRRGRRSKHLWGQNYLYLFDLEFKHEWFSPSLRLLVHPQLYKSVNPPLLTNLYVCGCDYLLTHTQARWKVKRFGRTISIWQKVI